MNLNRPEPRFKSKAGKLRYSGDWTELTASRQTIQKLFDEVEKEFSRNVARKVVNMLCLPPYRLGPILDIGTADGEARLADCIALAGRYVRGAGFFYHGVYERMTANKEGLCHD